MSEPLRPDLPRLYNGQNGLIWTLKRADRTNANIITGERTHAEISDERIIANGLLWTSSRARRTNADIIMGNRP